MFLQELGGTGLEQSELTGEKQTNLQNSPTGGAKSGALSGKLETIIDALSELTEKQIDSIMHVINGAKRRTIDEVSGKANIRRQPK